MRMLVDSFHKIVRHHRWIQRLGVLLALLLMMLAFLAMVQHWRGPKMWSHRVQQPEHIHCHGSIPNAHNQYICIFRIFRIHSSRLFNCTRSYIQITIQCLFCYCCHNCNRPQSALCSEGFTIIHSSGKAVKMGKAWETYHVNDVRWMQSGYREGRIHIQRVY